MVKRLARENAAACVDCHGGRRRSHRAISFKLDLSRGGAGAKECLLTNYHA